MADDTIRGYRVVGDRPRDRQLSFEYLKQDGKSAKLNTELRAAAVREGANCLNKWEVWDGDDMPTDREAQMLCASCPVFDLCKQYAEASHPAWTILAGKVYGRKLKEALEDEPM